MVETRSKPRVIARLDLAIALLLAVVTFLILLPYLQPYLQSLRGTVGLQFDEGTELYNSELLRRGWALYRDTWDFKGPVSYVVFALGFALSEASVENGRITVMVVIAIWSALAFLCGRAITRRYWPSFLLSLLVPLCVWPNWPYAYNEYVAQCLLVGALLAALHATDRPRLWVVCGALASLGLWTSLGQGLAATVSLGVAAALLAYATGRGVWPVLRGYAIGVALPSGLMLSWLVVTRSLRAGLHAIFVFPFTNYVHGNETEWGFDRAAWIAIWDGYDEAQRLAVRAMTGATVHLPRVALALSIVIAALLLDHAFFRHYTGRTRPRQNADLLARAALPAALVATAVPPFLGYGRSDLCHLGFVESTCSFVVAALAMDFGTSQKRRSRLVATVGQAALGAGVGALLCLAGYFHWHNLHQPFKRESLDLNARLDGDYIAARTRPSDRVYVIPGGGYHYLSAKRDAGIRFPVLHVSPYYNGHWPTAADDVVRNRPRLMLVGSDILAELAKHRPEITSLYFGYSGNYILDERRPGPELEPVTQWQLREVAANGTVKHETMVLKRDASAAHYTVKFAEPDTCLAALDEDRVSLFRGNSGYVGRLSADGRHITGTIYSGTERRSFSAERGRSK